jgi:hypothetical protein
VAADKVVLDTPRYKGEFELDFEDEALSALEWRWVKKISGYTLGTVGDGIGEQDPSLFIAWAVVALCRAGRVGRDEVYIVADELSELPFDGSFLRYEAGAAEETEADPTGAAAPETPAPPRNTGGSSNSTSARPEPALSPIGAPG